MKPRPDSDPPKLISTESDRKWRRLARQRNGWGVSCLGGLGCALTLLYLVFHIPSRSPALLPVFGAFYATGLWWSISGYMALRCQSRLLKHVDQTLQSKDPLSLSSWIDLLYSSGAQAFNNGEGDHIRAAAGVALREYLPLLTEETASLLTADDRHALYKALRGRNTELISVVLQVVPLLGDASALPNVQHLADGKGVARKHPELQAQAGAVLPTLQARIALNSSSAGLLRASQPPPTPPEELLLPAQAHNVTDPTELLRAENRK